MNTNNGAEFDLASDGSLMIEDDDMDVVAISAADALALRDFLNANLGVRMEFPPGDQRGTTVRGTVIDIDPK
jgi:hypothetical protein